MSHIGPAEWIGIVALLVALMALPTVFQMIWGRAHIDFVFGLVRENGRGVLQCTIYNRPVSSKLLRTIGVRRDGATVYVAYKIFGADFVTELIHPQLATARGDGRQVELVAGPVGASMGIIYIKDGNAYIVEDPRAANRDAPLNPINPGTYRVAMVVFCGEKNYVKDAEFIITANAADSYWVH